MKKIIPILFCLALAAGCKKDITTCKNYKQNNNREPNVAFAGAPELADTLAKYPELQLSRFYSDNYGWNATCRVYYGDLLIFSDYYSLSKVAVTGTLNIPVPVFRGPLAISLEPSVSYEEAIREAKKWQDFDHTCISYRLGLFNISYYDQGKDYRLAWRIEGAKGSPYVVVDAVNKAIVQSSSGVVY